MVPGLRESERVHPNVVLAVLSLAAVTYAVLSSAVIPALPTLQHSLNASETGVTWLLTGFLLSASIGTAIIGKLGDMTEAAAGHRPAGRPAVRGHDPPHPPALGSRPRAAVLLRR